MHCRRVAHIEGCGQRSAASPSPLGYLWNGNHREALACIDGLANDLDDLEDLPTTYPGIKAFRKGVDEFRTYVTGARRCHTASRQPARSRCRRRARAHRLRT